MKNGKKRSYKFKRLKEIAMTKRQSEKVKGKNTENSMVRGNEKKEIEEKKGREREEREEMKRKKGSIDSFVQSFSFCNYAPLAAMTTTTGAATGNTSRRTGSCNFMLWQIRAKYIHNSGYCCITVLRHGSVATNFIFCSVKLSSLPCLHY